MSDTPRNDAFRKESRGYIDWLECSAVESFARQLERELTAAKAEIERLTRERDEAYAKGFAEARERAANLASIHYIPGHSVASREFAIVCAEKIRAMKPEGE